jgi:hypothetical protein
MSVKPSGIRPVQSSSPYNCPAVAVLVIKISADLAFTALFFFVFVRVLRDELFFPEIIPANASQPPKKRPPRGGL